MSRIRDCRVLDERDHYPPDYVRVADLDLDGVTLRRLARHTDHVTLDGRCLIDADRLDDLLRMLVREGSR